MNYLIKNVVIRNLPLNGIPRYDVFISDGKIVSITNVINNKVNHDTLNNTVIIDGTGLSLLPGLVDMHVHFRQPGFEAKETIATGSKAAAHGGFTTVCTMPNLNPAPDSPENLEIQSEIIRKESVIKILPYATITLQRKGKKCVEFSTFSKGSIAGFSDDGSGIQSEDVMKEALSRCAENNFLLAAHCEVNDLLKGGYIHDGIYAEKHQHRGICSESEWREIERNIRLAEETGARLHICHISTAESVELIRDAKKRGVKITCETAPHYLVFCDEDLKEEGKFKMNPPIRSFKDKEALIKGIQDGTIDVIATDHAPHTKDEKSRGLEKSAMGVAGIEASLPVIYTHLVKPGIISFGRMLELMADKGREILGIENDLIGELHEGIDASLTLVDFNKDFSIQPEEWLSLGKSTPFEGMRMQGKVLATFYKGTPVFYEIPETILSSKQGNHKSWK